jgi:hypothetical protein
VGVPCARASRGFGAPRGWMRRHRSRRAGKGRSSSGSSLAGKGRSILIPLSPSLPCLPPFSLTPISSRAAGGRFRAGAISSRARRFFPPAPLIFTGLGVCQGRLGEARTPNRARWTPYACGARRPRRPESLGACTTRRRLLNNATWCSYFNFNLYSVCIKFLFHFLFSLVSLFISLWKLIFFSVCMQSQFGFSL